MTSVTTKVGDVFEIPIDGKVGHGQIVAKIKPNPPLIAVFERLYAADEKPSVDEIMNDSILLLINSFDVKITSGEWPVVGNRSPDDRMVLPAFKTAVGNRNEYYVISYDAKRRRPATRDEAQWLPLRMSVAPVLLQKALRAHHGYEAWNTEYDAYRYETAVAAARVAV